MLQEWVTGLVEDPNHVDKLPVGFAKTEGASVPIPQVGFTCSFCHTTQFRYKEHTIRIEGGPSLQNNATFVRALVQRLGILTPPDMPAFLKSLKEEAPPEPFKTFATRVLASRGEAVTAYTLTKLAQDVRLHAQSLISRSGRDISPEQWGPGRFDALGRGGNMVFVPLNPDNLRPANAPVSIPPLWGVWEFDWVQWAGSIQHPLARNIGQVIGVNAGLFSWARPGIPIPAEKSKLFHSSVDVTSLTTLENLARRLPPPQWPSVFPAINRELATRGKDLYHGNKAKGVPNLCAHCHVPAKISDSSGNGPSLKITMVPLQEIGTDSLYLENFSQRTVDTGFLGRGRISAREASEYVTSELMAITNTGNEISYRDRPNTWRDTAQYIARPHLGIWATAPYLIMAQSRPCTNCSLPHESVAPVSFSIRTWSLTLKKWGLSHQTVAAPLNHQPNLHGSNSAPHGQATATAVTSSPIPRIATAQKAMGSWDVSCRWMIA